MGITLISNNCSSTFIYHDSGLRFDSPTILLQIMPAEYSKFCSNLEYYLSCDIRPYPKNQLSDKHKEMLLEVYYEIYDFPYGLCDDIMIVFQHYNSFEEGLRKWNERRQRVDLEHLGFIFMSLDERTKKYAYEFDKLNLPNKVIFTKNYDVDCAHYRYDLDPDIEDFEWRDGLKRNYEQNFDREEYLKKVRGVT